MRNIFYYIILTSVFCILFSNCSTPLYLSSWQQSDFSKENHFKEPLRYYNAGSRLEYNITNDKKNLFICIKTNNSQTLYKIMHAGLQIDIDTFGNNKNKIGILYPLPVDDSQNQFQSERKAGDEQDRKAFRSQFILKHIEMYLTGFKPPIGDNTLPLKNKYGIFVSFDWDSTNTLVYKLAIPFRTFYKDSLMVSDSSRKFGVSFTVNALPRPESDEANTDNSGGMPGMGGSHGGMGGMGGMGGGMRGMNSMNGMNGMGGGGHPASGGSSSNGEQHKVSPYESSTFKLKVKFAQR